MKKSLRMKSVAVMSAFTAISVFVGSCTVDMDKISSGFEELGSELNEVVAEQTEAAPSSEATEATTSETSAETAETTPEPTATPTPTNTPTPTPTPTATPTPTPLPERVDFSELTQDDLYNGFTVDVEDFGESYVEPDEVLIATFSGNRLLVETENESLQNIRTAVNLILDGFYAEAEGLYNRYIDEGLAAYELSAEADEPVPADVSVIYDYSGNGRVLSITMEYSVVKGEEVLASARDYACFDMYTGQYVTLSAITNDLPGLNGFLAEQLAASTEDEHDRAGEYADIYIMAADDGITVYGTRNGEEVAADISASDLSPVLNRYGLALFPEPALLTDDEEADEETDEEAAETEETEESEETEETEETDETGETEESEETEETEETEESEETEETQDRRPVHR